MSKNPTLEQQKEAASIRAMALLLETSCEKISEVLNNNPVYNETMEAELKDLNVEITSQGYETMYELELFIRYLGSSSINDLNNRGKIILYCYFCYLKVMMGKTSPPELIQQMMAHDPIYKFDNLDLVNLRNMETSIANQIGSRLWQHSNQFKNWTKITSISQLDDDGLRFYINSLRDLYNQFDAEDESPYQYNPGVFTTQPFSAYIH